MKNTGLIYVFTGEGKGKTSAALGVATRAALIGHKVVWISFYKGKDWDLAEKHLPERLNTIEMHFVGKGFMIPEAKEHKAKSGVGYAKLSNGAVVIDKASDGEHHFAAQQGLELARQKMDDKPFLLVLDEVLNAVDEGLVEERHVLELLNHRSASHIVLTGRLGPDSARSLLAGADLVTECRKIKHPYDKGKLAIRGLDF